MSPTPLYYPLFYALPQTFASMEMEIGKAVLVMCVEYDYELCVSKLHYAVRSTALPLFVLVNVKCQVCTACTAVYRVINLKR